jgi:hypothetical protein
MSTPMPLGFAELVDAVRALYRGTKHERTWSVGVRQPASATGPLWEIWVGNRQLVGDSPEHVLDLARLTAFHEAP